MNFKILMDIRNLVVMKFFTGLGSSLNHVLLHLCAICFLKEKPNSSANLSETEKYITFDAI